MHVSAGTATLVDYRTMTADHMYISDVLGAEDNYDQELAPLTQRLHVGGITPDEYESARARIAARAAAQIADAHDRWMIRNA